MDTSALLYEGLLVYCAIAHLEVDVGQPWPNTAWVSNDVLFVNVVFGGNEIKVRVWLLFGHHGNWRWWMPLNHETRHDQVVKMFNRLRWKAECTWPNRAISRVGYLRYQLNLSADLLAAIALRGASS